MADRPLIAIRATPLLFAATGVAQYIRSLARELAAAGENIALFSPFRWGLDASQDATKATENVRRTMLRYVPRPRQAVRAIEAAFLAVNSRRHRVSLYHEPAALPLPYEGPTVVTVHDLSWVRFPDTHPSNRVAVLSRAFPRALERVRHVITDSEFTRRELFEVFGVRDAKITTVHLAARDEFRPRTSEECAACLATYGLDFRRFVLSVGTLEPRKNLEILIRAYSAMPEGYRQKFPLVLAGAKGWLTSRLETALRPLVERGFARPLGYVPDEALALLYSSAHVFVYPSLYEGFGLPPLEAMASGTPVIASNSASHPEVVGGAGHLIDPHDDEGLRMALMQLAEDEDHWQKLAEAGFHRSSGFSWARCARETRDVYRKVLLEA